MELVEIFRLVYGRLPSEDNDKIDNRTLGLFCIKESNGEIPHGMLHPGVTAIKIKTGMIKVEDDNGGNPLVGQEKDGVKILAYKENEDDVDEYIVCEMGKCFITDLFTINKKYGMYI